MSLKKHELKEGWLAHTYCSVESSARKFLSFPLDHLLTSASRTSANLCQKIIFTIVRKGSVCCKNLLTNKDILRFSRLALAVQEDHDYSSPLELLPGGDKKST